MCPKVVTEFRGSSAPSWFSKVFYSGKSLESIVEMVEHALQLLFRQYLVAIAFFSPLSKTWEKYVLTRLLLAKVHHKNPNCLHLSCNDAQKPEFIFRTVASSYHVKHDMFCLQMFYSCTVYTGNILFGSWSSCVVTLSPVSSLFSFILQGFSNSLEYLATLSQTLARWIKRANERGTVFDDVWTLAAWVCTPCLHLARKWGLRRMPDHKSTKSSLFL